MEEQVKEAIIAYLEAAKEKDFSRLSSLKAAEFTKFGEVSPYHRLELPEANALEQLQFASLADLTYEIEDLRVQVYGDIALASFLLSLKGVLVDDYSFTGALHRSLIRATMVLKRERGRWLHLHHHLSSLPEGERRGQRK